MPAEIFKENSDVFSEILQSTFNEDLVNMKFPEELKSSLHKKDDKFNKKNYRPITILPSVSKINERIMESQIIPFANNFLSPMLCGFRRNYNTQHTLLRRIENCKEAVDTKHSVSHRYTKKMTNSIRKIIDPSPSYLQCQKKMRELWNPKLHPLLITFCHQCYVASEGFTIPNIHYSDV